MEADLSLQTHYLGSQRNLYAATRECFIFFREKQIMD